MTINRITRPPGQRCFTWMHGMGMSNRDMWQCLQTLNGRMPQDEAQIHRTTTQLRRYGHLVEQQERQQQLRHFPTTAENGGAQPQMGEFDVAGTYPGAVSSPLLGGGGGAAVAPSVHVPTGAHGSDKLHDWRRHRHIR